MSTVADVHREIETKYDVPPDFVVPDLRELAASVDVDQVALSSTYYDTTDQRLRGFRLTLRRRLGDADRGWHVKIPGLGERIELHWPAEGDELPAEASELLEPFLRGAPVSPTVRLDTVRTRHQMRSGSGDLLAEIAHDDVRASGLNAPVRAPRWHEVEVELGDGSRELLDTVGRRLVGAGAHPSTSRSKLARALLGVGNEGVGAARTSAGAVLVDYISTQVDALVASHFGILRDEAGAVHRARVAGRRLRSTLRSFAAYFDATPAAALENELRWYAGVLGEVRDRDVQLRRLQAAVAALPTDLVVGPVAEQITTRLRTELAVQHARLLETMASARYADLLASVARWRTHPPLTAAAGRPAATLRADLDRVERQLNKRLAAATARASSDDDVHRARKVGKRARYAAEAAAEDSALVAEATALQDLLGEFQDSVGAQALLRQLAADASLRGEDGFTYGVLVADERHRAEEARRQATRG